MPKRISPSRLPNATQAAKAIYRALKTNGVKVRWASLLKKVAKYINEHRGHLTMAAVKDHFLGQYDIGGESAKSSGRTPTRLSGIVDTADLSYLAAIPTGEKAGYRGPLGLGFGKAAEEATKKSAKKSAPRKHAGVYQSGPKKGRLKRGYRYGTGTDKGKIIKAGK